MVAYSFKAQFAPSIKTLLKQQTVRADRKRHARPGEMIQLYQGMRTRHCKKIMPDVVCTDVQPILIVVDTTKAEIIASIEIAGIALSAAEIEQFACADGFAPELLLSARQNMGRFWQASHGFGPFSGVIIRWAKP